MKSVQWLTEIEVVDQDFKGCYHCKGWTGEATVKTTDGTEVIRISDEQEPAPDGPPGCMK